MSNRLSYLLKTRYVFFGFVIFILFVYATPRVSSASATPQFDGGGYFHSVAVEKDGTVWVWGYNEKGQLGDGTIIEKRLPYKIDFMLDQIDQTGSLSQAVSVTTSSAGEKTEMTPEKEPAQVAAVEASSGEEPVATVNVDEPSNSRELAVRKVVNEFWVHVWQNNWRGILNICSKELLDQYYKLKVDGLGTLLKFGKGELESYMKTVNDPKEQKIIEFAILYKDGKFDVLQDLCNKMAAQDMLAQFQGKVMKKYDIKGLSLEGKKAIVYGSFTYTLPEGTTEIEQKTTQLLVNTDGKWEFGVR